MFVHSCRRTNIKLAWCHNSWHCYIKILLRKYINTLIMYIVFSWWCDCNREPRNGFTPHCFKLWENTISFCCLQLCWTILLCWNCVYILRGQHYPVFFFFLVCYGWWKNQLCCHISRVRMEEYVWIHFDLKKKAKINHPNHMW